MNKKGLEGILLPGSQKVSEEKKKKENTIQSMTGATGRVVNLIQQYSRLHVYMYMLRLAQVFIQSPTSGRRPFCGCLEHRTEQATLPFFRERALKEHGPPTLSLRSRLMSPKEYKEDTALKEIKKELSNDDMKDENYKDEDQGLPQ